MLRRWKAIRDASERSLTLKKKQKKDEEGGGANCDTSATSCTGGVYLTATDVERDLYARRPVYGERVTNKERESETKDRQREIRVSI